MGELDTFLWHTVTHNRQRCSDPEEHQTEYDEDAVEAFLSDDVFAYLQWICAEPLNGRETAYDDADSDEEEWVSEESACGI